MSAVPSLLLSLEAWGSCQSALWYSSPFLSDRRLPREVGVLSLRMWLRDEPAALIFLKLLQGRALSNCTVAGIIL